MARKKYNELAKAKIQDTRNIIISSVQEEDGVGNTTNKGYTIVQQLEVQEANRKTFVFLKNALHLENLDALKVMRDALNVAISKEEEND